MPRWREDPRPVLAVIAASAAAAEVTIVGEDLGITEDMLAAVVEISKMRGGLSVVRDGKLLAGLPLPVAGLMSDGTLSEVVSGLDTDFYLGIQY